MTTTSTRRPISTSPKSKPKPTRRKWFSKLPRFRKQSERHSEPRPPRQRERAFRLPELHPPKLPELRLPKRRVAAKPDEQASSSASPTVHPRIADRRDEVAQAARRGRAKLRWVSLGVAAALTAVAGLAFSPLFDMDHLVIEGVQGSPELDVREVSGLEANTALVGVHVAEVRDRIEDLGWVAHAEVQRVWPDRVEIRVRPHRPVAVVAIGDADPAALGTASGRVLDFGDVEPLVAFTTGLPVLRVSESMAIDSQTAALRPALSVITSLGPGTAGVVGEVSLDDAGNLVLSGRPGPLEGAQFIFGDLEKVPQKSEALEAALSGAIELSCLARVDVSVPSRVTVLRLPDCTMPVP